MNIDQVAMNRSKLNVVIHANRSSVEGAISLRNSLIKSGGPPDLIRRLYLDIKETEAQIERMEKIDPAKIWVK